MKIACLTDTHWSARRSSHLFLNHFENFYKNVFFPFLEQEGITTVMHLGDAFDNRNSIDFLGLDWTRRVVLEPLSKYEVHMITGNHDVFYKSTNNINSPSLLLQNYKNIHVYSDPTEIEIDNLKILMLPWINFENEELTQRILNQSQAEIVMGHLELQGFRVNRTLTMEHGMSPKILNRFKKVFSGHYHTRSNQKNIFYIGNPYEMFWTDVEDPRGFCVFDTETFKIQYINNPFRLFYNIYYEDTDFKSLNVKEYENKIVKVIVRKKTDQRKFDKFLDKLYSANVHELKIVENYDRLSNLEIEELESEDTVTVLNKYVEDSEINLDKSILKNMIQEIYKEACESI